ncbi:MAG: histidinol phosphate phosphatase domain-containing protein [Methanoculleaceae archaeon]
MYDLHTHTLLSDGEMLPIELIRRMAVAGYKVVGITDHADMSNLRQIITPLLDLAPSAAYYGVQLLVGVELTHLPPPEIPVLARRAKDMGADLVVVHGETTAEPVAPGTNRAACLSPDVDILAHPGLITDGEARLAAENGVALELTFRHGHNRTNGHVLAAARRAGCQILINSDAHAPGDIMTPEERIYVARGAGMTDEECRQALSMKQRLLSRL